jgi:predicted nucleic acid-binding protein
MKVVLDSSCIIVLSQIRRLDILTMLFSEISIPRAVFNEFMVKASAEEKNRLEEVGIKVVDIKDALAVMALQADLGKGESECIVLAKELDIDLVVLDDKYARRAAEFLGLNVVGTLGILVRVHKEGRIRAKPLISKMREKGFWIDDVLYKRIMSEIESKND